MDEIRAVIEGIKAMLEDMKTRMTKLENGADDREKRLRELEIREGANAERFKSISDFMEKLNKRMDELFTRLDKQEKKPGQTYEKLVYEVTKYILIAGVAFAIAKLF